MEHNVVHKLTSNNTFMICTDHHADHVHLLQRCSDCGDVKEQCSTSLGFEFPKTRGFSPDKAQVIELVGKCARCKWLTKDSFGLFATVRWSVWHHLPLPNHLYGALLLMTLKSMFFSLSNASALDFRREPEASISALKSSPQWKKHKDFKTGIMNEVFLNFVTWAFS